MLSSDDRRQAAESLAAAERDASPIERLTVTHPAIEVADAYAIQRAQIDVKLSAGRTIRGHKAGLTSRAMQTMMGVDEPDFGHLLDDMFVPPGGVVELAGMCQPRVEFEVAFILREPLTGPDCTADDVLRAVDYVSPSIEIIDSRFLGWEIGLCDTIADNASSALVVLGDDRIDPRDLDLRTLGVVVSRHGELIDTGAAGAVLGHPATAVAWLANKLHSFGTTLDAGHVILPGSCTRAHDVAAGDTIVAEFAVLGSVSVSFA